MTSKLPDEPDSIEEPVEEDKAAAHKPVSTEYRPEITRLPRLTLPRKIFRRLLHWISRAAVCLCTRTRVTGLENFPERDAALVVVNHLGDADVVIGLAFFPGRIEALAKMEMYDYPVVGKIMDAYGVIWLHRGRPDRRAIRDALDGLKEGRLVGIAPEGRESVTGSLEEGTGGAAYLALKAGVPIVPAVFTGSENARIYGNLKRLRRTKTSLTVGQPFRMEPLPEHATAEERRAAIVQGTSAIMLRLAELLPQEYRGIYNG